MEGTDQYTDLQIIQKIIAGEPALFEILIRRNNPFLYRTGRSYNYSHEDTQDLMQETFVDAFLNLSLFENRSSFKTWITRIMLNNCYRKSQKSGTKIESAKQIDENSTPMFNDQNTDTSRNVVNRELGVVIESALKSIPDDYRMVFSLRELSGFNVIETAEILAITQANVKVRLNRAKNMLRKEIEKSYTTADIFEFNLVFCDAIVARVMSHLASDRA